MSHRSLAVGALAVVAALAVVGCTPETVQAPRQSSSPAAAPTAAEDPMNAELRDAAWQNDVRRAGELIAAGADVNAKDETQQSAYLIATSEGYLDLLRLTLAHGGDVDATDSWNGTGLIRAAERGHGYIVGELLQARVDATTSTASDTRPSTRRSSSVRTQSRITSPCGRSSRAAPSSIARRKASTRRPIRWRSRVDSTAPGRSSPPPAIVRHRPSRQRRCSPPHGTAMRTRR